MPPKKKVKKPPVKQKQKQSQSQKVIINLQDLKTKSSTRRRKPVKKQTEQNIIPRGWNVYSTPDRREIDEIRGQLINVQNKLVNPKVSKNEVGREAVKYYSREDNIGDFSNKMKFVDNEKKEQEKQSRNLQGLLLKEKKRNLLKELKKRNPKRPGRRSLNPLYLTPVKSKEEEEPEFSTITETQFV